MPHITNEQLNYVLQMFEDIKNALWERCLTPNDEDLAKKAEFEKLKESKSVKTLPKELITRLNELKSTAAQLAEELNDLHATGTDYQSDRSDKWREKHDDQYDEFLAQIQNAADLCGAIEEIEPDDICFQVEN